MFCYDFDKKSYHLLHDWGKWQEGEATYRDKLTLQTIEKVVQIRDCRRCGKREVRQL